LEFLATPKRYYDLNPSSENQPGDIWSGLPTHGLLGTKTVHGLVITPACDLSNRKVETITYLPIISVLTYFSSIAYLPDVRRNIDGLLSNTPLRDLIEWPDSSFPPEIDVIANIQDKVSQAIEQTRKEKEGVVQIFGPDNRL